MPDTTACRNYPFPLDGDDIDVAGDVQRLAVAVDSDVCAVDAHIDALAVDLGEMHVDLNTHLSAPVAHSASAVSFVPTGTISATNVQAAIAEVAAEAGAGGTGLPDGDFAGQLLATFDGTGANVAWVNPPDEVYVGAAGPPTDPWYELWYDTDDPGPAVTFDALLERVVALERFNADLLAALRSVLPQNKASSALQQLTAPGGT